MSAADEVRQIVRASRAAQGLPATIEDPTIVAKVAALIRQESAKAAG